MCGNKYLVLKTAFRLNGNVEISISDNVANDFCVFNHPVSREIAKQIITAIELAHSRGRISHSMREVECED